MHLPSNMHIEAHEGIKTHWDTPIWILNWLSQITDFCTRKRTQLLRLRDIYFRKLHCGEICLGRFPLRARYYPFVFSKSEPKAGRGVSEVIPSDPLEQSSKTKSLPHYLDTRKVFLNKKHTHLWGGILPYDHVKNKLK